MQINTIIQSSYVDGPGRRTVIFLQGCTLACLGCQNRRLWPADGGYSSPPADVAQTLADLSRITGQITISGGEPFQQPQELAELLIRLRALRPDIHILVYTGYTWEQLLSPAHPAYPWMKHILPLLDVLVDGPFVRSRDDDLLAWRGSRNQRPLDVQASLEAGQPVVLDWDNTLTLTPEGNLVLSAGLAASLFFNLGPASPAPICGQTVRRRAQ